MLFVPNIQFMFLCPLVDLDIPYYAAPNKTVAKTKCNNK